MWNEGVDKVMAEWLATRIANKEWFVIGYSALATMGFMSFLAFMPIWYQLGVCTMVTVLLGRVAWLAGKINAKKS
jgi:predicted membrane channel-forming protein YqfA (hemolysin III family)